MTDRNLPVVSFEKTQATKQGYSDNVIVSGLWVDSGGIVFNNKLLWVCWTLNNDSFNPS